MFVWRSVILYNICYVYMLSLSQGLCPVLCKSSLTCVIMHCLSREHPSSSCLPLPAIVIPYIMLSPLTSSFRRSGFSSASLYWDEWVNSTKVRQMCVLLVDPESLTDAANCCWWTAGAAQQGDSVSTLLLSCSLVTENGLLLAWFWWCGGIYDRQADCNSGFVLESFFFLLSIETGVHGPIRGVLGVLQTNRKKKKKKNVWFAKCTFLGLWRLPTHYIKAKILIIKYDESNIC